MRLLSDARNGGVVLLVSTGRYPLADGYWTKFEVVTDSNGLSIFALKG